MRTSVRTEILDDSISGDKIHGGMISGLDGLYTDSLWIPDDGTATGGINGSTFYIGLTNPVGAVFSESMGSVADAGAVAAYDASWTPRAYLATNAARGYMEIWSTSQKTHRLSSWLPNYILPPLLIGKIAREHPSYLMEIEGGLYVDTLNAEALTADVANLYELHSSAFFFLNPFGTPTEVEISAFYSENHPIYLGLPAILYEGAGKLTDAEAQQLTNIGTTTISAVNWGIVGQLDNQPTLPNGLIISDAAGEDALTTHHHVATTAQIKYWSSPLSGTYVSYPVEFEVINNIIHIYLPEWEYVSTASSLAGYFMIDLSNTAFDPIWDKLTATQYLNGPIVQNTISPDTGDVFQTVVRVLKGTDKRIDIFKFESNYPYILSPTSPFPTMQIGDKIKINTSSLSIFGES